MHRDDRFDGPGAPTAAAPSLPVASFEQRIATEVWDARAEAWDTWTGPDGDENRRYNSDPVLWRMLGDVAGKDVLDAGCGAGYLSVALARAGAQVLAIDVAPRMVDIAARRATDAGVQVSTRVDSASELATVRDASVDCIVSNYVLMDLPDLDGACRAFARVLRPSARAVVIVSHPCFTTADGPDEMESGAVRYTWSQSYFDEVVLEAQWGPFSTPSYVFHRPINRYWKAFTRAGLVVEDIDEPVVPESPPPELDPVHAQRYRMTPFSIAFALRKGG